MVITDFLGAVYLWFVPVELGAFWYRLAAGVA